MHSINLHRHSREGAGLVPIPMGLSIHGDVTCDTQHRCHRRVAANFGSGAFKHLEEEILKAAMGDLPKKQSKATTWEESCRSELQVGPS